MNIYTEWLKLQYVNWKDSEMVIQITQHNAVAMSHAERADHVSITTMFVYIELLFLLYVYHCCYLSLAMIVLLSIISLLSLLLYYPCYLSLIDHHHYHYQ